jgi:hypothetical protein
MASKNENSSKCRKEKKRKEKARSPSHEITWPPEKNLKK